MDILTTKQAVEITGLNSPCLRRLARLGKVPGAQLVGRDWLFTRNGLAKISKRKFTKKSEWWAA